MAQKELRALKRFNGHKPDDKFTADEKDADKWVNMGLCEGWKEKKTDKPPKDKEEKPEKAVTK